MRLFAGIALDRRTRDWCADVQNRLRDAHLDARYEPAEKLHVTLAFLGNVEPERVPEVERVLQAVAPAHEAFELVFDRIGAFPNERRPRIVWIGSRGQSRDYRALAASVREAYGPLGWTFEDDAIAHVTVARIKGGGSRPVPMLDLAPVALPVASIVLFESQPGAKTTVYTVRSTAPLR